MRLERLRLKGTIQLNKLNLDFQALMSKYEDDITYYKETIDNIPRQTIDSVGPEFLEKNANSLNDQVIEEMKENEEFYLKKQKEYQNTISELQDKVMELEKEHDEGRKTISLRQNFWENVLKETKEDENNTSIINDLKDQISLLESTIQNLNVWIEEKEKDIEWLEQEVEKHHGLQKEYDESKENLESKGKQLVKLRFLSYDFEIPLIILPLYFL